MICFTVCYNYTEWWHLFFPCLQKRQRERSDKNRNMTTTFCRHDHGEEHSEDMSFDELEGTLEVSWADDGSTFHIGHRV